MSEPLHFHYSREERLAMPGAPRTPPRGGIFKNNRSLVFLLVDTLLLAAVIFVYRQWNYRPPYRAEIAGYSLVLRGVRAGDDVLAVLEASPRSSHPSGDMIFVVFRVGEAELRLSEYAPAGLEPASVSGRLFAVGPARELTAEVSVAGERAVLRRVLARD